MPLLGLKAAMGEVMDHDDGTCPFCEDEKKTKARTDDEADDPPDKDKQNWNDDDPKDTDDIAKQIDNDSGKLRTSMGHNTKPVWTIKNSVPPLKIGDLVGSNPHHLIPGNQALKASDELLKWIYKSIPGSKITGWIGYSVNDKENGVWLPSNDKMSGNAWYKTPKNKVTYALEAMNASMGRSYHDSHDDPYGDFVRKILAKLANRLNGKDAKNPACPNSKPSKSDTAGKYKPPYALRYRLYEIAGNLSTKLIAGMQPGLQVYTSKLVPLVWKQAALVDTDDYNDYWKTDGKRKAGTGL